MSLGQRIKELRDKKGYSQDELAQLVGVSKSAISLWEVDKTSPTSKKILKLAEVLGVTVENLKGISTKLNESPVDLDEENFSLNEMRVLFKKYIELQVAFDKLRKERDELARENDELKKKAS